MESDMMLGTAKIEEFLEFSSMNLRIGGEALHKPDSSNSISLILLVDILSLEDLLGLLLPDEDDDILLPLEPQSFPEAKELIKISHTSKPHIKPPAAFTFLVLLIRI